MLRYPKWNLESCCLSFRLAAKGLTWVGNRSSDRDRNLSPSGRYQLLSWNWFFICIRLPNLGFPTFGYPPHGRNFGFRLWAWPNFGFRPNKQLWGVDTHKLTGFKPLHFAIRGNNGFSLLFRREASSSDNLVRPLHGNLHFARQFRCFARQI